MSRWAIERWERALAASKALQRLRIGTMTRSEMDAVSKRRRPGPNGRESYLTRMRRRQRAKLRRGEQS